MSRARFLADNDLNEYLIDALARREPTTEPQNARQKLCPVRPRA